MVGAFRLVIGSRPKLIPLLHVWFRMFVTDHSVNGCGQYNGDTAHLPAVSDPLTQSQEKSPPKLPAFMCRHISHASLSLRRRPYHGVLLGPDVCAPPFSACRRIHSFSEPLPPLHLLCDLEPSAPVSSPSALSRLPILILLGFVFLLRGIPS